MPIGPGLATLNGRALTVRVIFVVAGLVLGFFASRRLRLAGTGVMPAGRRPSS